MDTVHWPQEISMKPMEEIIGKNIINSCSKTTSSSSLEKRSRPQKDSAVNCPRCNSTNTKFCYYNNYSLSQPRYFCKTCRRYWTEGGTLRNVPVGGGSRKNKIRSSSYNSSFTTTSSIISSSNKKLPDLVVPPASTSQNPSRMHHEHAAGQDLNLGFPSSNDFKTISQLIQLPNFHHHDTNNNNNNSNNNNNNTTSALQLLSGRGGGMNMINSFMPIPIPVSDSNSVYSSSGELMPDFKIPSLNFSLDGSGIHDQNSSGMLLFPFEDVKTSTISTTTTNDHGHLVDEQNRDQNNGDTNGFWSGMLGGGSW